MQEKSKSSEAEEEKTKTREAPWIHPDVVAGLIRSGEAEDRDRPALIRLYLRAQMNFFAKPGKSGKGKNYWPDNQTIADSLGVSKSDIQNALRDSDIERIDGGKGRGEDKRFRIVKKERNHGGKKDKGGKGKTSNLRDQSDSEYVESTSAPRNIDVCQPSNQRLKHVESTSAIGVEGDGLEKRGVEGEGGGSLRACAREAKSPPPPVSQVSFKKVTAEEALEFLNDNNLVDSDSLTMAYYGLVAKVCGASLHDGSGDADKASLLLKGIPAEFRRQDVIASWMIWYVFQLSPKWNGDTHYLTRFSASWVTYKPIAEAAQKAKMAEEEKQRAKEIRARIAQQRRDEKKQEEIRLKRQKAEAETKRLKAIETEARLQQEREEFHKSLPTLESIRKTVDAVAVPSKGLEENMYYLDFMTGLIKAVPVLGLVQDYTSKRYDYIPIARESFGGDLAAFEQKTRDFVVEVADHYIGKMKANGHVKLQKLQATWEMYARFFKIDPKAEWCSPKTMVSVEAEGEYISPFGEDD